MKTKYIIMAIELIFILAVIVFLLSNKPKAISPNGLITESFNFEFENAKKIIISKKEGFENPIIIKKNQYITLPPGTYYWKAKNLFRESEVKNFTILSKVALDMEETNETYKIKNTGNVDLNVTEKRGGIIGYIILEIGKSAEVEKENNTIFEGEQK